MPRSPNMLRWDGRPGHYEVYYVTLTDPASGVGLWIRYTMVAPLPGSGRTASAALWFVAFDPRRDADAVLARKQTVPVEQMAAGRDPFELRIGDAVLNARGISGAFDDVAWDLRWTPSGRAYEHVHPVAERLRLAQTVLELPEADLAIEGTVAYGDTRLEVVGARGGQAHLWGAKHAEAWAWVHCNDLLDADGRREPGAFVDAVSVRTRRGGRELGPFTPVVGRFAGRDFHSVSPWRVVGNWSSYTLTGWRFEAVGGRRRLIAEVDAERDRMAGVTYQDPDGDPAYCYNTETASIRLHLYERASPARGWAHVYTLRSDAGAHFEYAQRAPVPHMELHLT